jgi:DDE family transposase
VPTGHQVRILLRAASGFARETLMKWYETKRVDFLSGLAKNDRLTTEIVRAEEESKATSKLGAPVQGVPVVDTRPAGAASAG